METNNANVRFFYLLLDIVILNMAIFLVSLRPHIDDVNLSQKSLYLLHANMSYMAAYIIYARRNYYFRFRFLNRLKDISIRFVIFIPILFVFAQMFLSSGYSHLFIIEYTAVFYLIKVFVSYTIHQLLKYKYDKGFSLNRVAVLGLNDTSTVLANILENNPSLGLKMVGYITDNDVCENSKILGKLDDLPLLTQKHKINTLIVAIPDYFATDKSKLILDLCNNVGLRVRYLPISQKWIKCLKKKKHSVDYFEMYNPQEIPLDNIILRGSKRVFDILFSSFVILFIFSWLFPIIGLMIKINSKGPVFFVQKRTGINNKTFNCIKFRTMKVNKDADTKQATNGDARITSIGSMLRKYNIDELPQFINVFLGHMSVVGPRPHMLKHTEQYSALIQSYKVRHFVKPGITGWAQVNGYRGLTDELWKMQKRVDFDMKYLENWNFAWDIYIIYQTVMGKDTYKNAM